MPGVAPDFACPLQCVLPLGALVVIVTACPAVLATKYTCVT